MAYAEIANSKLKVADTNPMQRVCADIRMWCEDVVMVEGCEDESVISSLIYQKYVRK